LARSDANLAERRIHFCHSVEPVRAAVAVAAEVVDELGGLVVEVEAGAEGAQRPGAHGVGEFEAVDVDRGGAEGVALSALLRTPSPSTSAI
jgi:hypothetical protein